MPRDTTPVMPGLAPRFAAELVGTFVLVLGGCGSAVISAGYPDVGIGLLGVSLAFGLTVLGCAYALGPISGCHLNPAVTAGLVAAGRFPSRDIPAYVGAQTLGALAASAVLLFIVQGQPGGYDAAVGGLAANGYAEHSPGKYGLSTAMVTEVVLTFIFLTVILGSTSWRAASGFAGIPIGLTLTLVHLVGIPVTNVSVNPARSTGPALFVGGWALQQLWLFWVAPLLGAVLAGLLGRWLHREQVPAPTAIPAP
jgi:aquaporin Z